MTEEVKTAQPARGSKWRDLILSQICLSGADKQPLAQDRKLLQLCKSAVTQLKPNGQHAWSYVFRGATTVNVDVDDFGRATIEAPKCEDGKDWVLEFDALSDVSAQTLAKMPDALLLALKMVRIGWMHHNHHTWRRAAAAAVAADATAVTTDSSKRWFVWVCERDGIERETWFWAWPLNEQTQASITKLRRHLALDQVQRIHKLRQIEAHGDSARPSVFVLTEIVEDEARVDVRVKRATRGALFRGWNKCDITADVLNAHIGKWLTLAPGSHELLQALSRGGLTCLSAEALADKNKADQEREYLEFERKLLQDAMKEVKIDEGDKKS